MMIEREAVVLLSGGQDSTTCLYWALSRFRAVRAVSIDYGQKHRVELESARENAEQARVEHVILPLNTLDALGDAALTNFSIPVSTDAQHGGNVFAERHGLPSTFVPGRNLMFFTIAAAYGARYGIRDLVTGVCQTDDAGYPDCRRAFVIAAERAIETALGAGAYSIYAPLLRMTKADTWALADELNILDVIVEKTHTCYHGVRGNRYPWGRGCGACGACAERSAGYRAYVAR